MASIYFNSEFVGNRVPLTERFRGLCFRPLHYFFEGQTRYWTGYTLEGTQDSYPANQKSWPTSLKMAVLIVPGFIVGAIAAVVAMAEWYFTWKLPNLRSSLNGAGVEKYETPVSVKKGKENSLLNGAGEVEKYETPVFVKKDKENSFVAPTYELTAAFSPNKSHGALCDRWAAFISKLTAADSWKNLAIRTEFSELIEEAHKEMNLVFQHVANAAGNDPAKMAQLMRDQHAWSGRDEENYCRAFFYRSIGPMYYAARSRKYFKKEDGGGLSEVCNWDHLQDSFNPENTQPFFTPGTPEYRWRRLYNDACALIDRYPGLREALKKEDDRFVKCAIPHDAPSSGPSSWEGIPTFSYL